MAYINFDDIPLVMATPVRRTQRRQLINFGDGYSQILTDGLNIDQERWRCETPPLPYSSAYSIGNSLAIGSINPRTILRL